MDQVNPPPPQATLEESARLYANCRNGKIGDINHVEWWRSYDGYMEGSRSREEEISEQSRKIEELSEMLRFKDAQTVKLEGELKDAMGLMEAMRSREKVVVAEAEGRADESGVRFLEHILEQMTPRARDTISIYIASRAAEIRKAEAAALGGEKKGE